MWEFNSVNRYLGVDIGVGTIHGLELPLWCQGRHDVAGLEANGVPIFLLNGDLHVQDMITREEIAQCQTSGRLASGRWLIGFLLSRLSGCFWSCFIGSFLNGWVSAAVCSSITCCWFGVGAGVFLAPDGAERRCCQHYD